MSNNNNNRYQFESIIIGAGFGGVGLGIKLQQAGRNDFLILEKADSAGGCWRDNTYPGAACDIPSHLYSFSFEPNPNWQYRYAKQGEIRDYIEHCITKYQLSEKIAYQKEVVFMRFDVEEALWNIETGDGAHYQSKYLVTGVGQLNRPAIPKLEGIEQFKGKVFHSAQWDHEFDLSDKKIAVIGTGASAVQFVPVIADKVASCTVFQRAAPYVLPKSDGKYKAWQKQLFSKMPWTQSLSRLIWFIRHEGRAVLFGQFKTLSLLPKTLWKLHLNKSVKSKELREKLTPDYRVGCKRILITSDYYDSFNKPQMSLNNSGVGRITENSIIAKDGQEIELDAIIYGTGFKSTEFLAPMNIVGLQGKNLNQEWAQGAEAYKGISVHGFPNLMMMYGPNTNGGHNSIIYILESQFKYIVDFIEQTEAINADFLDVKSSRQESYNQKLHQKLAKSVWVTGGCNSWYQTKQGKIVNNWAGYSFSYRQQTKKVKLKDYQIGKKGEITCS